MLLSQGNPAEERLRQEAACEELEKNLSLNSSSIESILSPRLLVLLRYGSPQKLPVGERLSRWAQQGARLLPAATSAKMLETELGPGVERGRAQGLSQPAPGLPQALACLLPRRQRGERLAGRAAGEQHHPPAQGLETAHVFHLRPARERKAGPPSCSWSSRGSRWVSPTSVRVGAELRVGHAALGRAGLDGR